MDSLLGSTLLGKDGNVTTTEALAGKKAVALYFSAHWCPPCRGFTPKLAEWYKTDLQSKGLEVVFVSSDQDEDSFNSYYGEQPWLALPYAERDGKAALNKKFKVNGIPSLVIVDAQTGELITADGRAAVSSDPTGEKIPWTPPTKEEKRQMAIAALGDSFVDKDGAEFSKAQRFTKEYIGLYFSAHWCPPCRVQQGPAIYKGVHWTLLQRPLVPSLQRVHTRACRQVHQGPEREDGDCLCLQ